LRTGACTFLIRLKRGPFGRSCSAPQPPLFRQQDRNRRACHDALRNAAHDRTPEQAVPVSAHDASEPSAMNSSCATRNASAFFVNLLPSAANRIFIVGSFLVPVWRASSADHIDPRRAAQVGESDRRLIQRKPPRCGRISRAPCGKPTARRTSPDLERTSDPYRDR
jgi:hypothetical protein